MVDTQPGPAGLRLLVDGRPVAPVEVAASRRARAIGLIGRDRFSGALLLVPASSVHTFVMRFAIDVARCTAALEVVDIVTLPPGRVTMPRRRVHSILEAEAGSFAAWGIGPGCQLAIVR